MLTLTLCCYLSFIVFYCLCQYLPQLGYKKRIHLMNPMGEYRTLFKKVFESV